MARDAWPEGAVPTGRQGRTLTDFAIASAHDAAVRVIEETQTIRLSFADSRVFAAALLKAAARRYPEPICA